MLANVRRVVALLGFAGLVWLWNSETTAGRTDRLRLATMFLLLLIPPIAAWIGRILLRRYQSSEQIAWITLVVHYSVMFAMGLAFVSAFKMARLYPLYRIAYPSEAALFLVKVTASLVLTTVLTLALRGLGAPFAIALSRRLATDWLYRYTRNPMVVSLIAFLVAMTLWLQSTLFGIWACVLVASEISVLKLYEERELELRFGQAYLTYKQSTPMLLGRRRKEKAAAATNRQ